MRVGSSSSSPSVPLQLLDVPLQRHPGDVEQDVAGQRVAVGVQPGGCPWRRARRRGARGRAAASSRPRRSRRRWRPRRSRPPPSGRGARRSPRPAARSRPARQPSAIPATTAATCSGTQLADRDVVLQEQRLRPADHEVVHHHRDQVQPDRVVTCPAPARSRPWCRPRRSDAASTGSVYRPSLSANSPANPPIPPITSGPRSPARAYGLAAASTARLAGRDRPPPDARVAGTGALRPLGSGAPSSPTSSILGPPTGLDRPRRGVAHSGRPAGHQGRVSASAAP
jgi:hypothetical protein